jgi:hypothetical protein
MEIEQKHSESRSRFIPFLRRSSRRTIPASRRPSSRRRHPVRELTSRWWLTGGVRAVTSIDRFRQHLVVLCKLSLFLLVADGGRGPRRTAGRTGVVATPSTSRQQQPAPLSGVSGSNSGRRRRRRRQRSEQSWRRVHYCHVMHAYGERLRSHGLMS